MATSVRREDREDARQAVTRGVVPGTFVQARTSLGTAGVSWELNGILSRSPAARERSDRGSGGVNRCPWRLFPSVGSARNGFLGSVA